MVSVPLVSVPSALLLSLAFVCNSCSSDKEEVVKEEMVSYTLYFDLENGSAPDGKGMNDMLEAFRKGLNVESNNFQLYGNMDECDSYVYETCERVYESFSFFDFPGGFYSPRVMNNNRKRIIWSKNFAYFK